MKLKIRTRSKSVRPVVVNAMALGKAVNVVVKVKRLREFKIRIWLAKKVMKFGARLAGLGIVFEQQ